jgi:hypothetical protein
LDGVPSRIQTFPAATPFDEENRVCSCDTMFVRESQKNRGRELATNTRFPAENLEKVLHLRELLTQFHKNTYLRGKLVLKPISAF